MWRVFRILIFLVLIASAAGWLANHPGTLRFDWLGYRVDTSVAILVFAIVALTAVAAVLYRFWIDLRRAPRRVLEKIRQRRREKGFTALSQGLVAVAAGDVSDAKRQARRAENLLAEPAVTRLLSAQAAQLAGDTRAARRFFTDMLADGETEFLGLRGLLMQAMKQNDKAEALRYAERAFALKPASEWVAKTAFDLQVHARRWRDAEATVQRAVKSKALSAAAVRADRAAVLYQMSLLATDRGDRDGALAHARKAHDLAPEFIPAALHLARLQIAAGRQRKAAAVLETAWAHAPHPALADLYGEACEAGDAMRRVRAAQFLAGLNPGHVESRLAVAEAALEARLWGVARAELEAAVGNADGTDGADGAGATARVCRCMAALDEAEHGSDGRAREWLMRAASAGPDAAWVCGACGNTAADWQVLCGNCGSFNAFSWRPPTRVLALPDAGAAAGSETGPAEKGLGRGAGNPPPGPQTSLPGRPFAPAGPPAAKPGE
ncbi:MAG: heme biosynthesis HemY N-terminal domain-containing protein [Rhodospirillales bacterium]